MDATNDMNKYSLVGKTKEFLSSFASVRAEEGRELAKRDLLLLMRAGARGKDVSLIRQSLEELSGRGELDQDVHTAALFALAKNAEFKEVLTLFHDLPNPSIQAKLAVVLALVKGGQLFPSNNTVQLLKKEGTTTLFAVDQEGRLVDTYTPPLAWHMPNFSPSIFDKGERLVDQWPPKDTSDEEAIKDQMAAFYKKHEEAVEAGTLTIRRFEELNVLALCYANQFPSAFKEFKRLQEEGELVFALRREGFWRLVFEAIRERRNGFEAMRWKLLMLECGVDPFHESHYANHPTLEGEGAVLRELVEEATAVPRTAIIATERSKDAKFFINKIRRYLKAGRFETLNRLRKHIKERGLDLDS
jgi:hypothetical protein